MIVVMIVDVIVILYFFVLVYHMKETGWVKISQDDTMKLHYQYLEEKKAGK